MNKKIIYILMALIFVIPSIYFYAYTPDIFFFNLSDMLLIFSLLLFTVAFMEKPGPKKILLLGTTLIILENLFELYLRSAGKISSISPILNTLILTLIPFSILLILLNYKKLT